jgi:hypothetical protein
MRREMVYLLPRDPNKSILIALYLTGGTIMMMHTTKQGVTDRSCRGPRRPGVSAGRHAPSPVKPEQLRGPTSPHRKAGPSRRSL